MAITAKSTQLNELIDPVEATLVQVYNPGSDFRNLYTGVSRVSTALRSGDGASSGVCTPEVLTRRGTSDDAVSENSPGGTSGRASALLRHPCAGRSSSCAAATLAQRGELSSALMELRSGDEAMPNQYVNK